MESQEESLRQIHDLLSASIEERRAREEKRDAQIAESIEAARGKVRPRFARQLSGKRHWAFRPNASAFH